MTSLPDPVGPLIKVVRSARAIAIASSLRPMPAISVDDPTSGIDTRPPDCCLHIIESGPDHQIENQQSSSRSTKVVAGTALQPSRHSCWHNYRALQDLQFLRRPGPAGPIDERCDMSADPRVL